MARRWQIISVELLSGRGKIFVPPPGRDLILPPSTPFEQLGVAIDLALARWDLGHLRDFTLADGTRIIDDATDLEAPGAQTDTVVDMSALGFADEIARPDELYDRYGAPECDTAWRP